MVNRVNSGTLIGLNSYRVWVETDVINSLPAMSVVGLPDAAVNEARDRVKSAIKNSGYTFPSKKVVVNLAPADVKKNGTGFDLPIAVGILIEEEVLTADKVQEYAFIGELALDGLIRSVNGVLPLVLGLKEQGIKNIIVPKDNAKEAALIEGINVYGAYCLGDVVGHFTENPISKTVVNARDYLVQKSSEEYLFDFRDVKGQQKAKKALEIAAAGGHNVLMTGSPGAGKTMMAKCFPSILPPLELEEALELTKIYSVSGLLSADEPLVVKRPFRSVHHTASANGIIGGGSNPKPGEITLAHRGVLFLDELPEFSRSTLEILRQPMEDKEVNIARAAASYTYPADFLLCAAMNPCKCGYYPDITKCRCTDADVQKYLGRISGPLLDRIDICVEASRMEYKDIRGDSANESSARIRERVSKAVAIQHERYEGTDIRFNSDIGVKDIDKYCHLGRKEERLMREAFEKIGLSARAYHRMIRVARTIADLDGSDEIRTEHLSEAIGFRNIDRRYWNG